MNQNKFSNLSSNLKISSNFPHIFESLKTTAYIEKSKLIWTLDKIHVNTVVSHHRDHQWLKVNCKSHSFRGMRTNNKSYPS